MTLSKTFWMTCNRFNSPWRAMDHVLSCHYALLCKRAS
jgi:hypothetical protein